MFLMFNLNRPDIFPAKDIGLLRAVSKNYKVSYPPSNRFLKKISNNMKNALVIKSNIFVMPSIIYKRSVEGFGIAFIEAAQYGLPSLGGLDGGATDAIINNVTGILCNGNNLNEIHESIEKMLNKKKYIELGKNAKKNSENFLGEKIVLNYKKILIKT